MRGRGLPVSRSAWSMSGPRRQLNTPRPEDRNPPEVARIVGPGKTAPSVAEPAVSLGVRPQRAKEVEAAEVGPQRVTEVELRVRTLPEQEATKSLLARRADDEVRVGLAASVEVLGDVLDVEQRRHLLE